MGKKIVKGNEEVSPLLEEESKAFLQGVIDRLTPNHQMILGPLPRDVLRGIIGAVCDQLAASPELTKKLLKHVPPPLPTKVSDVRQQFEEWGAHDESGIVSRALGNGLAEHLTPLLNAEMIAEYHAWRTAMQCGECDIYNRTQTVSGFQDAVNSVDRARRELLESHHSEWNTWSLRMQHGTSLRIALLEYWLPLGLWAMSIEDAIRCLTLYSMDAVIGRFTQKEREDFVRAYPERKEFIVKGKLKTLSPTKMQDKGAFKKAVTDLHLFRLKSPLVKLSLRGQKVKRPLYDFADKRNKIKAAPETARIAKLHRADPSNWDLMAISGETLTQRW